MILMDLPKGKDLIIAYNVPSLLTCSFSYLWPNPKTNNVRIVPQHKGNDADNSDLPKRNYKVILLSVKVKVLNLISKEKIVC